MHVKREQALDLLNLSVAGMRDGVGPLLTVFLIQNTHWSPLHLSWVLAAPSVANLLAQVPAGYLFDKLRDQRILLALGAMLLAAAGFGVSLVPSLQAMVLIQLISGVACCLLSVGIPAVSLSSTPASGFGKRLARNEICSKFGNFGAIAVTGFLCQKFSLHWMFYVVYFFAAMVIISCALLKRGTLLNDFVEHVPKVTFGQLLHQAFSSGEFVRIVGVSFLFQFANASLFLIFEQSFVRQQKNGGAGIISVALFVTQLVIMAASVFIARRQKLGSPLTILRLGFVLILVRALVFAAQLGLASLAVAQILDGCIAAILIIVPLRAIAQLNKGSFNIMSGLLGTAVAAGATLSTLFAGYLIGNYGFVAAFLTFAAIAVGGVVVSWVIRANVFSPSLEVDPATLV